MKRQTVVGMLIVWLLVVILAGTFGVPSLIDAQAPGPGYYRSDIAVTAGGLPGSAWTTVTSPDRIEGIIRAIYVDYAAGISATTDLAITTSSPAATILSLTNVYTDGWYYPAVELTGSNGSGTTQYVQLPTNDTLSINYTQTSTSTINITVFWGN